MQQRLLDFEDTAYAVPAVETARQPVVEALTATQIEALGEELGITPSAVRQALQEKAGMQPGYASIAGQKLPAITRKDIRQGITLAAGYSAVGFVLLWSARALSDTSLDKSASAPVYALTIAAIAYILLMMVILPFSYAWRRKDWRRGFLLGVPLVLLQGLAMALGYCAGNNSQNSGFLVYLVVAAVALPLSMVGGLAGKWWHDRKLAEER